MCCLDLVELLFTCLYKRHCLGILLGKLLGPWKLLEKRLLFLYKNVPEFVEIVLEFYWKVLEYWDYSPLTHFERPGKIKHIVLRPHEKGIKKKEKLLHTRAIQCFLFELSNHSDSFYGVPEIVAPLCADRTMTGGWARRNPWRSRCPCMCWSTARSTGTCPWSIWWRQTWWWRRSVRLLLWWWNGHWRQVGRSKNEAYEMQSFTN